jgi:hypothetical protein
MSDNSYAQQMLNRIQNAQKMGGKDRLQIGEHRLALISFGQVENQKKGKSGQYRLVAEFEVQQSTTYDAGIKRSVSFFVARPEYPEYEEDRAKEFIDAVGRCVGDQRGTAATGADLLDGKLRGVVIDVDVQGEVDENGQPKRGARGNQFQNEIWSPLGQTLEQVQAAWAELAPKYATETKAAPQQQQTQAAPAPLTQGTPSGWGNGAGGGSLLRGK